MLIERPSVNLKKNPADLKGDCQPKTKYNMIVEGGNGWRRICCNNLAPQNDKGDMEMVKADEKALAERNGNLSVLNIEMTGYDIRSMIYVIEVP